MREKEMTMDTDAEFLNDLGATFEADGMHDEADRLRAIANKIAAQEGWELYAKEHGLPVRSDPGSHDAPSTNV
jgi:hypothetical protein